MPIISKYKFNYDDYEFYFYYIYFTALELTLIWKRHSVHFFQPFEAMRFKCFLSSCLCEVNGNEKSIFLEWESIPQTVAFSGRLRHGGLTNYRSKTKNSFGFIISRKRQYTRLCIFVVIDTKPTALHCVLTGET